MRRICVFCGSQSGRDPVYAESARRLGAALVARGLGLVYGGGRVGLMGEVAAEVLRRGGEVVGVIPHALATKEVEQTDATELVRVETMHQRKAIMADRSDAFAALPGGFGTCEELFEIVTWAQLGIHAKPVGLLNVAGFFDPLRNWLDHMVVEGFLKEKYRRLLLVADTPEALLDALRDFRPGPVSERWVRPSER